jgi:hypothetical protein
LVITIIISGIILFSARTLRESYPKSVVVPSSGSVTQNIGSNSTVKIAFIEPTFTDAAYADSFYVFYNRHLHEPSNKKYPISLTTLSL